MVPTMINHLIHHYSDHDHRQVKSRGPHLIDCSCNGFLLPRFHNKMKQESAAVAMQGSNPVLRALHAIRRCVMHGILLSKGVLIQKLYRRIWNHHQHKPELQTSQKRLDKSIYELDGIPNWPPQLFHLDSEASAKRMASLCAIASKLCYEKEEVIKDVVNGMWKMQFIEFFDCWNEYVKSNSTQAFMFADKEENANAVVIVFRGTEQNVADWGTDLDFFYYPIEGMGRVHVGFLEALGLATRLDNQTLLQAHQNIVRKMSGSKSAHKAAAAAAGADYVPTSGLPQNDQKVIAYDAICSKLQTILLANPEAKVFVTGHSLGGALAALFTAFLMHENDGIRSKLEGVFTFGQPRVGDASFAKYMEDRLCSEHKNARKYFRVVFRNDGVPRVPPDDVLFNSSTFRHASTTRASTIVRRVIEEKPDKNLLSDILQPMRHIAAINELLIHVLHHETDSEQLGDHSHDDSFHGHGQLLQDEEEELRAHVMDILTPAMCDHSCLRYMEAVKKAASAFLKQAT